MDQCKVKATYVQLSGGNKALGLIRIAERSRKRQRRGYVGVGVKIIIRMQSKG